MAQKRIVLESWEEEFRLFEIGFLHSNVMKFRHVRHQLADALKAFITRQTLLQVHFPSDVIHHFDFLVEAQIPRDVVEVELVRFRHVLRQSVEVVVLVRAEQTNNFDFLVALFPVGPVAVVVVEDGWFLRFLPLILSILRCRRTLIVELPIMSLRRRFLHFIIAHEEAIVSFVLRVDPLVSFLPHVLLQRRPILEDFLAVNADELGQLLLDEIDQLIDENQILGFSQLEEVLAEEMLDIAVPRCVQAVAAVQTSPGEVLVHPLELMPGEDFLDRLLLQLRADLFVLRQYVAQQVIFLVFLGGGSIRLLFPQHCCAELFRMVV